MVIIVDRFTSLQNNRLLLCYVRSVHQTSWPFVFFEDNLSSGLFSTRESNTGNMAAEESPLHHVPHFIFNVNAPDSSGFSDLVV